MTPKGTCSSRAGKKKSSCFQTGRTSTRTNWRRITCGMPGNPGDCRHWSLQRAGKRRAAARRRGARFRVPESEQGRKYPRIPARQDRRALQPAAEIQTTDELPGPERSSAAHHNAQNQETGAQKTCRERDASGFRYYAGSFSVATAGCCPDGKRRGTGGHFLPARDIPQGHAHRSEHEPGTRSRIRFDGTHRASHQP